MSIGFCIQFNIFTSFNKPFAYNFTNPNIIDCKPFANLDITVKNGKY